MDRLAIVNEVKNPVDGRRLEPIVTQVQWYNLGQANLGRWELYFFLR